MLSVCKLMRYNKVHGIVKDDQYCTAQCLEMFSVYYFQRSTIFHSISQKY